jgi:hypothetical protein
MTVMQASRPAPKPPTPSRLNRVISGKVAKPTRVVMYGPEGCGKSTFASNAPEPIFVGAEDGTAHLDVHRMPDVHTWPDVLAALRELDSEHAFRTVVIDTADWLEPMIWDAICAEQKKKNIEDFGYGKGYVAALGEWRKLTTALDRLRERRSMHAIVLAHSHVKTFKNPAADDFDRYEMKLHLKAGGLLKEWCDAVLFANFETLVHEKNDRVKGVSTGARIVYTERTAAWDAKNRYDLPPELPLDWDAFFAATSAHRPADPAKLVLRIGTLLDGVPEALRPKVMAAVEKANGNAAELARIADKLAAMVSISSKE